MSAVPTSSFSPTVPTTAVPDEAFLAQLQCQIEFYFSPRNLSRDTFLQNLLRNPQHLGAVPMETICSFPKIRDLYALYWGSQRQYQQQYQQRHNGPIVIATPPPPVLVRQALERSTVIQVTDDGKFIVPMIHDDGNDDNNMMVEPTTTMQPRPESAESFEVEESPDKNQPQKMVVAPNTPSTVNITSSPSSPSSQTTASCASSLGVPTHPLLEPQQPSTPSSKERTTVIVRDIPEGSTAEQVEEVFTTDSITPKSVRPDVGHTWYVTFATEAEAVAALEACHEKTIEGQPVRARLKSELTNSISLDAASPSPRRSLDPFLSPHNLSANNKSMVVVTTPQEQMASYMRSQLATNAVATPPPMMPYAFPPTWSNVSPQLYPYPHGYVANGFMPPVAVPYHHMAPPGTVFPFMAHPAFYPVEYYPQYHHQQAPPPNVFVRSSPTNHPGAGGGSGPNQQKKKKRKTKNRKNAKNRVPPPPSNHTIGSDQSPVSSITTDGTTNNEILESQQQQCRRSYQHEKVHHSSVTVASTATTSSNTSVTSTAPAALFPEEAFPALNNNGGNTLRSSETHTLPHRPAYSEALKQKPNKNANTPLSTFTSSSWPAAGESTSQALRSLEAELEKVRMNETSNPEQYADQQEACQTSHEGEHIVKQ